MSKIKKAKELLENSFLLDEEGSNLFTSYLNTLFKFFLVGISSPLFFLIQVLILPIYFLIYGVILLLDKYYNKHFYKGIIKVIDSYANLKYGSCGRYILYDRSGMESFQLPSDMDLKLFIYSFLSIFNKQYSTYDIDKSLICNIGKRRSFGDIYLICKTYFPYCTPVEVMSCLVYLLENNLIRGSYCFQINKYVFHTEHRSIIAYDNPVEYFSDDISKHKNNKFIEIVNAIKKTPEYKSL